MYHEQDEMYEKMSEFISQSQNQTQRQRDRIEELEDELQNKTAASGRYDIAVDVTGEKARVKELEAQMAKLMAQTQNEATTESFMSKQNANTRFRKQQQEIEELRKMVKDSKSGDASTRVWEDNLQSFVAVNATTDIEKATRGSNSLSKANVEALDNSTRKSSTSGVQRRERRSSSPRRRLSRYNSESGASDLEYEAMTAEMDRLADMKRSHQSRLTLTQSRKKELRVRSASSSNPKGTSNRAKLLAAADNLGNAVGGVTDSRASFGESH